MIGLALPGVPRRVAAPFVSALMFGAATALPGQTVNLAKVALCGRSDDSMENSREQRNDHDIRWRVHWNGDDCSVDLRASGDVKFTSDFTDIASVSNGGSVEITATQAGNIRRMTVKDDGRRIQRTWTVNGRDEPWSDDARRWLAGLLIELDRATAVGVDYRFPGLLARGIGAVIDEVQLMPSDYPRSVYLRRLIDSAKLNDGDYQRVLAGARDMHSDYERSRVLQAIVTKAPVSRDAGRNAIETAALFSSDYERSRVLLAAIENKALEADEVIPILETVTKSQSDYEKSRVLLAVAGRWPLNGESRKAYLRVADTIHSDYENRRVLSALVLQETRR